MSETLLIKTFTKLTIPSMCSDKITRSGDKYLFNYLKITQNNKHYSPCLTSLKNCRLNAFQEKTKTLSLAKTNSEHYYQESCEDYVFGQIHCYLNLIRDKLFFYISPKVHFCT